MGNMPLIFRTGLCELADIAVTDIAVTVDDRLPNVVEVGENGVLNAGTKLTEVAQETTDDN